MNKRDIAAAFLNSAPNPEMRSLAERMMGSGQLAFICNGAEINAVIHVEEIPEPVEIPTIDAKAMKRLVSMYRRYCAFTKSHATLARNYKREIIRALEGSQIPVMGISGSDVVFFYFIDGTLNEEVIKNEGHIKGAFINAYLQHNM